MRRVYDTAKTPLQRLLLSNVLPASGEHALRQAFQELDPVRLFEQVKDVQQALFVHAGPVLADAKQPSAPAVRRFSLEACRAGSHAATPLMGEPVTEQREEREPSPPMQVLLAWPRTRHDPFKEVWELIATSVLAHPERGSGELLRDLQQRFPGRYQPSHQRTLQRGLRKIRARLRAPGEEPWQQDVIQAVLCDPVSPTLPEQQAAERAPLLPTTPLLTVVPLFQDPLPEQQVPPLRTTVEERVPPQQMMMSDVVQQRPVPGMELPHTHQPSRSSGSRTRSHQRRSTVSIERAVQEYLESQRKGKRRPKTLQWHQTALRLFQQSLCQQCQCVLLQQITESEVQSWLTFLRETPTARGMLRSAGTIHSYMRSVRAFCSWVVRRTYLPRTPCAQHLLPHLDPSLPHLLDQQTWERLLQACYPSSGKATFGEHCAARNRALLWVLFAHGIRNEK